MEDSIPKEVYIVEAVKCLRLNFLGGPSVIQEEHIHQWLQEATWEEDPDVSNWNKVVTLVQEAFWEGFLPNACA